MGTGYNRVTMCVLSKITKILTENYFYNRKIAVYCIGFLIKCIGERGGLVKVEGRTPGREVGVRNLPPSCCVLE